MPRIYIALIGLVVILAHFFFNRSDLIRHIDYRMLHWMEPLTHREEEGSSSRVVVVDIDEESLQYIGQWPWPRVITAELFNSIIETHPAVVALDIVFAEPDRTSPLSLRHFYQRFFNLDVSIGGLPGSLLDHDAILAESLSRGKSVLPVYLGENSSITKTCDLAPFHDVTLPPTLLSSLQTRPYAVCNLPLLHEKAGGYGFFNASVDSDGLLRRIPLFMRYGELPVPALGMAALLGMGVKPVVDSAPAYLGGYRFEVLGKRFFADHTSDVLLHFYPLPHYRSVSAAALLTGAVDASLLQGKMVLIGSTATGLFDHYAIPGNKNFPGVFIQATLMDNLLDGKLSVQPRFYPLLLTLLSLVVTLLLLWLTIKQRYFTALLLWGLAVVMVLGVAVAALMAGVYISVGYFLIPLSVTLLTLQVFLALLFYQQRRISEALGKVATLLNSSGEGFLSFGPDLLIDPEYSAECKKIFGSSIAGQPLPALLYPGQEKEQKRLEQMLDLVFQPSNEAKQDILTELLADEIHRENQWLASRYKILENGHLMMILSDITTEKQLEESVAKEQGRLKFVVTTVQEQEDFFDVTTGLESFLAHGLLDVLDSEIKPAEKLAKIFREVHTFKGVMAQMDFIHTPMALHDYEDHLVELEGRTDYAKEDVDVESFGINEAFREDMQCIEEVLGREFLDRKVSISVTKERLNQITMVMQEAYMEESRPEKRATFSSLEKIKRGLELVRELRYIPLKKLLEGYPEYALELAERLEKGIDEFEVEGGEFLVDPERLRPFTKSLVHVFRNAVDHGIERLEEREEKGKEDFGKIEIKAFLQGSDAIVEIRDDGRGIDPERIRQVAVQKGIYSKAEAERLLDEEARLLIFSDSFSTKEKVSDLSGRGVGLAAVKNELEKIGGDLEVESEINRGTKFIFRFPR